MNLKNTRIIHFSPSLLATLFSMKLPLKRTKYLFQIFWGGYPQTPYKLTPRAFTDRIASSWFTTDRQVPKGSKIQQYNGDKIVLQLPMFYTRDNYLSFNSDRGKITLKSIIGGLGTGQSPPTWRWPQKRALGAELLKLNYVQVNGKRKTNLWWNVRKPN